MPITQVTLNNMVTSTLPASNGGTGLTAPGTAGNVLTSNGSAWTSVAPAAGGLGVGQTWQSFTGSRSSGTTYTNSTGNPIAVGVGTTFSPNARIGATVGGVQVTSFGVATSGGDVFTFIIVPNGATYVVTIQNAGLGFWSELR
jgi:hypothetical protein